MVTETRTEVHLPHTFRWGLDRDEHDEFTGGVVRVQVREPEMLADKQAPNPNRSPVYALFSAGTYELRVTGEDDWGTLVRLEHGSMSKRDLKAKLDGLVEVRNWEASNPDPLRSVGGNVRTVEAREITRQMSGAELDELEELRAWKAAQDEQQEIVKIFGDPVEAVHDFVINPENNFTKQYSTAPKFDAKSLHPKETQCPVEGCGQWKQRMDKHMEYTAKNGKTLRVEHQQAYNALMRAKGKG